MIQDSQLRFQDSNSGFNFRMIHVIMLKSISLKRIGYLKYTQRERLTNPYIFSKIFAKASSGFAMCYTWGNLSNMREITRAYLRNISHWNELSTDPLKIYPKKKTPTPCIFSKNSAKSSSGFAMSYTWGNLSNIMEITRVYIKNPCHWNELGSDPLQRERLIKT